MTAGRVAVCVALAALPAAAQGQNAPPRTHELKASASTVHRGFFDASLKPVLTIDSGGIVRLETASGNPKWFENLGVQKDKIPVELYAAVDVRLPIAGQGFVPNRGVLQHCRPCA